MNEIQAMHDQRRIRGEALARRVLDVLKDTIRLRPETPDAESHMDSIRVEMTMDSIRAIAPLVEAVQILEEIIFASDGCVGHRDCVHSMEPWQRARTLLQGKWEAEEPWSPSRGQWPIAASPEREPQ